MTLTILGCGAALPTKTRHPSAYILTVQDHVFLIDCGEGTQSQLERYSIKRSKIRQIFISHLHGDHVFGLMGLLTSYSLFGRTEAITLFSPEGLEEMIRVQLRITQSHLSYTLHFQVVDTEMSHLIFEDAKVTVHSIPLKHRVPTAGFLFREKELPRNIRPEKITEYNIPFVAIKSIKNGATFTLPSGEIVENTELTLAPPVPRSFAYCSDTMYYPPIVPIVKNIDLLYHEATFCENFASQATISMHSTAKQAALIAKAAQVKKLVIGHYSPRYNENEQFLVEAVTIFENTCLAEEGKVIEIGNW
jgi:ribonuclease Z